MSRHLLIPIDDRIPNLALMKVSKWAKNKGDSVDLRHPTAKPDEVWISCVFTWNKERALLVKQFYESVYGAIVHYGGTGFDWGEKDPLKRINLPAEIELLTPDYSLYDDDRAVGFCLRGCNRSCGFCDVPLKEGRIDPSLYLPIDSWVPENFDKVLLLDNDITLQPKWAHDRTILDCANSGRKLSITQGNDIRSMTEDRAKLLAEHKPYDIKFKEKRIYIAWDKMSTEAAIRRNVPILLDAGFKGREIFCYVIVGFDTTFEQDYHRYQVLWEEFGVYPFVMIFNNRKDLPLQRAFSRWVNRRIHKTAPWEEYWRMPKIDQGSPVMHRAD